MEATASKSHYVKSNHHSNYNYHSHHKHHHYRDSHSNERSRSRENRINPNLETSRESSKHSTITKSNIKTAILRKLAEKKLNPQLKSLNPIQKKINTGENENNDNNSTNFANPKPFIQSFNEPKKSVISFQFQEPKNNLISVVLNKGSLEDKKIAREDDSNQMLSSSDKQSVDSSNSISNNEENTISFKTPKRSELKGYSEEQPGVPQVPNLDSSNTTLIMESPERKAQKEQKDQYFKFVESQREIQTESKGNLIELEEVKQNEISNDNLAQVDLLNEDLDMFDENPISKGIITKKSFNLES